MNESEPPMAEASATSEASLLDKVQQSKQLTQDLTPLQSLVFAQTIEQPTLIGSQLDQYVEQTDLAFELIRERYRGVVTKEFIDSMVESLLKHRNQIVQQSRLSIIEGYTTLRSVAGFSQLMC